ncbi:lactation elevated protein 1-like protein [Sarcoptes scabiei]|uniref:Lactation elevated protein 1-like protein n=1 Tax=Sarcoptes scabiei TaxID=52283 RepID=A0A132A2E9_SARSC|nr:lactation elevated protein 1-like protein [Sarcoptes scabiei]
MFGISLDRCGERARNLNLLIHVSLPDSSRIMQEYQNRIRMGYIKSDPHQLKVIERFLALDERLKTYQPPSKSNRLFDWSMMMRDNFALSKWNTWLNQTDSSQSLSPPSLQFDPSSSLPILQGLYLHGGVGCGKTMLMDLFFQNCSIDPKNRQRIHFHSFMLDFHNRFHQHKQRKRHDSVRGSFRYDPIPLIAKEIVDDSWLLCLDEFQVTDIGDAMILKNFFSELFAQGMVVIATSNRPPEDLYKNGLQRSNFLPFIDILRAHCEIYELKSGIDYRRLVDVNKHRIYFVKDDKTNETLDLMFKVMSQNENDYPRSRVLTVKGRDVSLKRTCGRILDSSFAELCDRPLGAVDYLAMSQYFHTIIIRDIPKLTMRYRLQARRFITMIDTLYDHRIRVIFSSDVPCDQLFDVKRIENILIDDDNRKLMDDLGIGMNSQDLNASIFSGEEETFAFDRALSRLFEMQTNAYWNQIKID